jgi:integrase
MRQLYTPLIAVLNCAAHAGLCPKPAIKRPKVEHAKVSPSDDATIDTVMAAKGKIQFKLGSRGAKRQADARARLKALVLMITLTGCRISNAVDIVGRDLNLEGSEPDVIFRDTKNGDPRRVVLPPELVEALQALPKAKADERVLGYASRYTAAQAIERGCDAAGVPRVSPHQIGRHTFAARLLAAGYALKTVQEAGGWKDIDIVARTYGHLERSHVDAAVRDAAGTRLTRKASNETAKVLSFKQKE